MRSLFLAAAAAAQLIVVPLASAEFAAQDLGSIVLQKGEFGLPKGTWFAPSSDGVVRDSEMADATIDPRDDAAAVRLRGVLDGYESNFVSDAYGQAGKLGFVGSSVLRFATPETARAFIEKEVVDGQTPGGLRSSRITLRSVSTFPVLGIGEYAAGMTLQIRYGSRAKVLATSVMIQRANAVLEAWVVGLNPADAMTKAVDLARKLDVRAVGVADGFLALRSAPDGHKPNEPDFGAMTVDASEVGRGVEELDAGYVMSHGQRLFRASYAAKPSTLTLGGKSVVLTEVVESTASGAAANSAIGKAAVLGRTFATARTVQVLRLKKAEGAVLLSVTLKPVAIPGAADAFIWQTRVRREGAVHVVAGTTVRVGKNLVSLTAWSTPKRGTGAVSLRALRRLARIEASRMRPAPRQGTPIYSANGGA